MNLWKATDSVGVQQPNATVPASKIQRNAAKDLRSLVEKTVELPAMPAIAHKIIKAVDDPNSTTRGLASIVEADPGITAWVMRVSNSAIFGRRRKVTSLSQAVSLLGFAELRNLVVGASVRHLYRRFGPLERENWAHAVATGIGARVIAGHVVQHQREAAFLAGELHDVGTIVMLNNMADAVAAIRATAGREPSVSAEEAAFGFAHTDVGSLLMQKWNMPPEIEATAFYHHDLGMCEALAAEHLPLVSCVSLAEALLARQTSESDEAILDDEAEQLETALRVLDLSEDRLPELTTQIAEAVAEERQMLGK